MDGLALREEAHGGREPARGEDVGRGGVAPEGGHPLDAGWGGVTGEAGGVDGADRGPVDVVGRDAPGHQGLEHADLGRPPGPAAGEDEGGAGFAPAGVQVPGPGPAAPGGFGSGEDAAGEGEGPGPRFPGSFGGDR